MKKLSKKQQEELKLILVPGYIMDYESNEDYKIIKKVIERRDVPKDSGIKVSYDTGNFYTHTLTTYYPTENNHNMGLISKETLDNNEITYVVEYRSGRFEYQSEKYLTQNLLISK
jgi:hypothetical protein